MGDRNAVPESRPSFEIFPPSEDNLSSDNSISAALICSNLPMAPARTLGPVPEQLEDVGGAIDALVPADATHDDSLHGTQHDQKLPPQIAAALELDRYGATGGDKGVDSKVLRVVYGSSGSVSGLVDSPAKEGTSSNPSRQVTAQSSVTEVVLDTGEDDSPVAEGGISSPPLHMQVQSSITKRDIDTKPDASSHGLVRADASYVSSAQASLSLEEGALASECSIGDAPLMQHPPKDTAFAEATHSSNCQEGTTRGAKFPSGRMHVQMLRSYLHSCLRRLVARRATKTAPRHASEAFDSCLTGSFIRAELDQGQMLTTHLARLDATPRCIPA